MPANGSAVRLLLIGDIVGRPGRRIAQDLLPGLRSAWNLDGIIANAENSAAGSGITEKIYSDLKECGVDMMSLGDHAWKRKDNLGVLAAHSDCIRPLNYPHSSEGAGSYIVDLGSGIKVAYTIVLGRVFMDPVNCPYATVDTWLDSLPEDVSIRIVEFHGEATSEKQAAGWHWDGRVSAVVGSHTHVQTADARILPGGTGYISDLGMTGPYDGVIGRDAAPVLHKLLTSMHAPFTVAEKNAHLCGVILEIDPETGHCLSISPVDLAEDDSGEFSHEFASR
ncbi:metallophosphoesterase [bacterium TMED181]|nr:TIGR00282 family metallophosphoesterase [Planctomycetota bacterium]OUW45860.1 MAG: metallophosphoesterase [bacterium TMED181]